MKLKRITLSPSMIVAMVALFVALSGGAYATVALNQVRSQHIKNGEVKTVDLANSAVTTAKIKNNAVTSAKIKNGTIAAADLAPAAATDLNDASTVGGLSVAQIVAAAGGRYLEARQAAGSVDIRTLTAQDLVTLNLPEAGKYLITARMPVICTYDGSDATGATPDATTTLQPNIMAKLQLVVGGSVTDTIVDTCEAEAGQVIVLVGVFSGRKTVEVTRQIEVTGPTAVTLRGLSETSIVLFIPTPAAARVNASAASSVIQAITVRT